MRFMSWRTRGAVLCFLGAAVLSRPLPATAGKIEAVAGKRYDLSKQHGPWMIMVATFHTTADDGTTDEGKSPEQAADDLVYELRQYGLPAYVYTVSEDEGRLVTTDRLGRDDRRKNLRRVTTWGVIAGNYPSPDDQLAQRTLAYLKKLKPHCLAQDSGVVWYAHAGDGPFHHAFLSTNPLLTQDEVQLREQEAGRRTIDTLLIKLNSDENYSLFENKGVYTLQVKQFSGRQVVEGSAHAPLRDVGEDRISPLDRAAQEARDFAHTLREFGKIEAYVWHDHYQSIVTVGSFSSLNDPKLRESIEFFRAKDRVNPETGHHELAPEVFWARKTNDGGPTTQMWVANPQPVPIPVPRMAPRSGVMARVGGAPAARPQVR